MIFAPNYAANSLGCEVLINLGAYQFAAICMDAEYYLSYEISTVTINSNDKLQGSIMQIKPVTRIASMENHELTMIDSAVLSTHANYKSDKRWKGAFDVAAWVRFPEGLTDPAQLVVTYRDQERKKSYLVDRCLSSRQTLILLNGTVTLDVDREVEEISLCLKGLPDNAVWILDECHIVPKQMKPVVKKRTNPSSRFSLLRNKA